MSNIFHRIHLTAPKATEEDLVWMTQGLLEYFQDKLNRWAMTSYNELGRLNLESHELAKSSFHYEAGYLLYNLLYTWIFTKKHWQTNTYDKLKNYAHASLLNFTKNLRDCNQGIKRVSRLICPICKHDDRNELLVSEGVGMWRCMVCTEKLETAVEPLKSALQVFAKHSRKGRFCQVCHGFVPDNFFEGKPFSEIISCPFPWCDFVGRVGMFLPGDRHPSMQTAENNQSLDEISHGEKFLPEVNRRQAFNLKVLDQTQGFSSQSTIELQEQLIDSKEILSEHLSLLNEAIRIVRAQDERGDSVRIQIQRLAMIRAFEEVIKRMPTEMVTYLIHQKRVPGRSIQPVLFQEYLYWLEQSLPFESGGEEILSLMDEKLGLFNLPPITFSSIIVRGEAKNCSPDYVSTQSLKNYGAYFLGKILSIRKAVSDEDLLLYLDEYSFTEMFFDLTIPSETEIFVTHLPLIPHYETGHLITLQRTRKRIVQKVQMLKKKVSNVD